MSALRRYSPAMTDHGKHDCPVAWCDRRPNEHVANGVHQGVRFSAITSEPWRSRIVTLQVVAKGRDEQAAVIGLTLITEDLQQISAVLKWEQVRRLAACLNEAIEQLGEEDYEALYPGNDAPGQQLRDAFEEIIGGQS